MKKLVLLAVSAIIVASVGAQESNASKADNKRAKKECQMSKEQRIERDIQTLSEELYLSDEQAAKFAVTYREFMAEKAKLNEKFKAKFAKNLNERQVEKYFTSTVTEKVISENMISEKVISESVALIPNVRKP
jgi:predicted RND superfamily exporter protein